MTNNYVDNRPFVPSGDCPHCRVSGETKHLNGICRYFAPLTLAVAVNFKTGAKSDVTQCFSPYAYDIRNDLGLQPDEDFVLITCKTWHEYWKARITLADAESTALYARGGEFGSPAAHRLEIDRVEARCSKAFLRLLTPGWGYMPTGDQLLIEEVALLVSQGAYGLGNYVWEHVKDVLADIKLELAPTLSVDNVTGLEPAIGGR